MGIKTLHLTNAYHASSGGIRTMYGALMAAARRERQQIRLVVPGERDAEERLDETAVIYRLRAPRAPFFDRRYRLILPHTFVMPGRGRLWRILEKERPDVIEVCDKHSLCYFAGLVRRRRRGAADGPTLVGLSCERLDDNVAAYLPWVPAGRRAARAFIGHIYIGMFDAHLANSAYTAAELQETMIPAHRRPVFITPMGVDLPSVPDTGQRRDLRAARRRAAGLPLGAPVVLYAGRLSPEKQIGSLVPVAARLVRHQGCLVVAGDGPSRVALAAECARHAPGVARFVGHLDRAALQEWLLAADVFIHPNPREPFGIGPLEAMAVGLPVVLPRAGGVLTYATDENAWLVPASPPALAAGVEAALRDGARAASRAEAGRRTAAAFAWPARASGMLARYRQIHEARIARSRAGLADPAVRLDAEDIRWQPTSTAQ
jgi:glycosyltransferase involved in cell wall biosynthesis